MRVTKFVCAKIDYSFLQTMHRLVFPNSLFLDPSANPCPLSVDGSQMPSELVALLERLQVLSSPSQLMRENSERNCSLQEAGESNVMP